MNASDPSTAPVPVCIRLTKHNRNSVAALLAVLEAETPDVRPLVVTTVDEVPAGSLLVHSFMTPQAPLVRAEVARLRERRGGQVWALAGGPHPSGDPDGTLAMGFRWVGVGEAGSAFAALVRRFVAGELPEPGVFQAGETRELDDYPPWPESGRLFCQVEITRGCPVGCAFCQTPYLFGRRVRHRSLQAIERLLRQSVHTGHRYSRFVAPNAFAYGSTDGRTPNPAAVTSLLTLARRSGLQKVFFGTFPSEVRPESVTDEMLRLARELCDNRNLSVGLQSGSDEILRRLRRGHTVREGIDAVARMARAGFVPRVDFIFGLPGESEEDRRATRQVVRHITASYGARVQAHVFTPLPGTPLQDEVPAHIDERTRELIEALRGKGLASGHWTDPRRLPSHLARMHKRKTALETGCAPCDALRR